MSDAAKQSTSGLVARGLRSARSRHVVLSCVGAFAMALLALAPTASAQADGEETAAPADDASGSDEAAPAEAAPALAPADTERAGSSEQAEDEGDESAATQSAEDGSPTPSEETSSVVAGAYEEAVETYIEELEAYDQTIGRMVRAQYEFRKQQIRNSYDSEIQRRRETERALRDEAIEDFEAFLAQYPNNERFTPDVLFRLAELYYEKAVDDFQQADRNYQRELARYEYGLIPSPPSESRKDFSRTIELFERLVQNFPDYRQIDGAYYLLAIAYEENFELEQAKASLETLVERFPESDFAQEAWLRIGEYEFEEQRFAPALAAYEQALSFGETRWYDKILFKLGWSQYLLSRYDEGIRTFLSLLDYYDTRDEGGSAALKEEALQYTAVSLVEEDWDLDGNRDPAFVMGRIEQYLGEETDEDTLEILDRLATMLGENRRFEFAVQVYRELLDRDPLNPENPRRHSDLVGTLMALASLEPEYQDEAFEEQRRLGELYGPSSEWYAVQEREGNLDAIAYAEELARTNLLNSAKFYDQQAFDLQQRAEDSGDPALYRQAAEKYRIAARIYQQFLESYPNDQESYEARLLYAQALLFSNQPIEAAEQFAIVRDDERQTEYRELAAVQAVTALSTAIESEIEGGRMEPRALPTYEDPNAAVAEVEEEVEEDEDEAPSEEAREAPAREPIPELSQQLLDAYEQYIELGLEGEDSEDNTQAKFAFAAAKLLYDYKHFDEAREKFIAILDNYCGEPETGFSAALLIESYRVTGEFQSMEFWANEVERRSDCIALPDHLMNALREDIERFKIGAIAEHAEELYRQGKYEEAAEEYLRLAETHTDSDTAPLAIYNAGVIYEVDLQRYERAMRLFERIYTEFPESEQVDDSMVRVAVNSKRFFDFDRAIDTYRTLHERGYSNAEGVEFPILDAALLLEATQRYSESASAYLTFVSEHPSHPRAPAALYKAATLYEKNGDERLFVRTMDRFIREYGNTANTELLNIDAAVINLLFRAAEMESESGDRRAADRYYNRVLEEFNARQPEAPRARFAAAKAAYLDVEERFEDWNSIELGETVQEQTQGLTERRDGIVPLVDAYAAVIDYGSAEWSVCAYYKGGRVYQVMADLLYALPIPPSLAGDPVVEEEYIYQIETIATQFEDQAVAAWENAYPIMQQLGVVNECTIDMVRQLNRYRGSEYPLYKEELSYTADRPFTPPGPDVPDLPEPEPDAEDSDPVDDETDVDDVQTDPFAEGDSTPSDDGAGDEDADPFGE